MWQLGTDIRGQWVRVILDELRNGYGIQNICSAQQETALFIVFEVVQQTLEVDAGIRLPAVEQVQAQVEAQFLFRFQVVVFWLTKEQTGDGGTALVTVFVFGPEVFPAFVRYELFFATENIAL